MENMNLAASSRNKHRRLSTLALANVIVMAGASKAADTATTPDNASASSPETAAPSSGKTAVTPARPPTPANAVADASTTLNEVVVTAKSENSYQTTTSANGKYTESLLNTAQTITVIPKALIKDQNATTLRDVLKNVPGVTFGAGEGGTLAGDNITIRGFNAEHDIFVDGFRDTGVYTRDPFNLEQVEVVKGPASAYSGHGSTGGSVNLISKMPSMDPFYEFNTGYGTNQYYRETLDINQPLGVVPNAAFRLNAVYQYNNFSERDDIYDSRWGANPTLSFGLGTDTIATLSYFYLQEQDLPSFGLPVVNANAIASNPSLAPYLNRVAPVPYSNFYGLANRDQENTTTQIPTIAFKHDFDSDLKLTNVSRYENTLRQQLETTPRFDTIGAGASGNGGSLFLPPGIQVPPPFVPGSTLTAGPLPPGVMTQELKARHQVDTLLGNQTEITQNFDVWHIPNTLVGTVEFSEEKEDVRTFNGMNSAANLFDPNALSSYPFVTATLGPEAHSTLDDAAFSLFDDIKFTPQWILSGGMRYDHLEESDRTGANTINGVTTPATAFSRRDDLASWRVSLAYKPAENGTVYFGYGTSYNPSIEGTASDAASPDALTASTANLQPEKDETYELGTKWNVLNEKLSLTGAIFRTDKTNSRIADPTTSTTTILAGQQRVEGVEVDVEGELARGWKVFGGYTYMRSRVFDGPSTSFPGNRLPNTPEQTASLWSTYELPWHFDVGTGFQFVDQRYGSIANTTSAPGYCTQQLLVECQVNKNLGIQLNIYNLWDEHYIEEVGSNFDPGAGRSIVVSADVKF